MREYTNQRGTSLARQVPFTAYSPSIVLHYTPDRIHVPHYLHHHMSTHVGTLLLIQPHPQAPPSFLLHAKEGEPGL